MDAILYPPRCRPPAISAMPSSMPAGRFPSRPTKAAPRFPDLRVASYPPRSLIVDEGDATTSVHEVVEGWRPSVQAAARRAPPDHRGPGVSGTCFGLSPNGVSDVGAETLTKARIAIYEKRRVDADPDLRDRIFTRLRAQMCAAARIMRSCSGANPPRSGLPPSSWRPGAGAVAVMPAPARLPVATRRVSILP